MKKRVEATCLVRWRRFREKRVKFDSEVVSVVGSRQEVR